MTHVQRTANERQRSEKPLSFFFRGRSAYQSDSSTQFHHCYKPDVVETHKRINYGYLVTNDVGSQKVTIMWTR